MTIKREDLDTGRVDLSDEEAGDLLPTISPGDIVREEYMKPLGLTQYALAKALDVPAIRLSQVLRGKRAVTADMAIRLATCFHTSPQFWLGLQAAHDLELVERERGAAIRAAVTVPA